MMIMILYHLVKAIILIPVWVILGISEILVKLCVKAISLGRGLLGLVLTFLLVGTLIWYRYSAWRYLMLFVCAGASMAMLLAGVWLELIFEDARKWIGSKII